MDKARLGGLIICVLVVAAAGAFIFGLAANSGAYWRWAVGVPVGAGVLLVCALGFWIGWTMLSTKVELPPPAEEEDSASE